MLKTNKKQSPAQKGFTIIEVLIVLAIAGLILLIVFLAVPALQRNSRNTSIRSDVQNVLGGVAEFQGANNGVLPSTVETDGNGKVNYTKGTGSNATSINVQGTTEVKTKTGAPNVSPNNPIGLGSVEVSLGYRCNGSASTRAVAAVFAIETTDGKAIQCTES